jgi:3-oxoacyl-[acyl-carrier-protein] synthase II
LDEEVPAGLNIITGQAIEKPIRSAMSNTFGFGGHNAIVVFKKI